jgi:hypothetical protein
VMLRFSWLRSITSPSRFRCSGPRVSAESSTTRRWPRSRCGLP